MCARQIQQHVELGLAQVSRAEAYAALLRTERTAENRVLAAAYRAVGDHYVAVQSEKRAYPYPRRGVTMVPNVPPEARQHLGRYSLSCA